MWKIRNIIVCVTCTVFGILVFPLFVVFCVLVTGFVLFYDLPESVHVASIRRRIESLYSSAVDSFQYSSRTLFSHHRQVHSNGILNNHELYQPSNTTTNPNLISPKFCKDQDVPESFTMPLSNCNLHSTPLGTLKDEPINYSRKHNNFDDERHKRSWYDEKLISTYPKTDVIRNVQTVAGPLLASTRFNTFVSAELTADANSLGFSSRVAQKGTARNNGVTHQSKYCGVGVFPIVQLNSRSPKHSFSSRNNSSASKSVRVKIAPPDNSPLGGLDHGALLAKSGDAEADGSMKAVLQVLKEMSRKRIHSQVDEDDDENVKRQKKENGDETGAVTYIDGSGLQNKRGRDDSPRSSEEVKRQRRQMAMPSPSPLHSPNTTTTTACSNEIMSSLSSSLAVRPPHLIKGTKRKAHVVDWSGSSTPVSGKLLKVNSSPPTQQTTTPPADSDRLSPDEKGDASREADKWQVQEVSHQSPNRTVEEAEAKAVKSKTGSESDQGGGGGGGAKGQSECVRIEAGKRRVLARCGDVKEIQVHEETKWHEMTKADAGGVGAVDGVTNSTISLKKMKDPGKRLKEMLAAIDGSDDIETDSTSMSPSVIAILKTAKPTTKCKTNGTRLATDQSPATKWPVSILKVPGCGCSTETNKTVTFSQATAPLPQDTTSAPSSPQTCLTTATVVSNSINTSISSALEISPSSLSSLNKTTSPQMLSCITSNPLALTNTTEKVSTPSNFFNVGVAASTGNEPGKPTQRSNFTFSDRIAASSFPIVSSTTSKQESSQDDVTVIASTVSAATSNYTATSQHAPTDTETKSTDKSLVENAVKSAFTFGNTQDSQSNNKLNVSLFGNFNSCISKSTGEATSFLSNASPSVSVATSKSEHMSSSSSSMLPSSNGPPVVATASQMPSLFGSVASQSTNLSQKPLFSGSNTMQLAKPSLTFANKPPLSTNNGITHPNLSGLVATQPIQGVLGTASGSGSIFTGSVTNKTDSIRNDSVANVTSTTTLPLFGNFTNAPAVEKSGFGVTHSTSNAFSTGTASVLNSQTPTAATPAAAAAAPVFSFGSPVGGSTESDKTKQPLFGGTSFQSQSQSSGFSFGSSTPTCSSFGFGNSTNALPTSAAASSSIAPTFNATPFKQPEQRPFAFDSTMQPQQSMFGFSQPAVAPAPALATAPAPAFQFNANASLQQSQPQLQPQPATSGVFSFGAPAPNSTNSPFGGGMTAPTFSIGSSGGAGSTMFNIGSGNSSARPRSIGGRPRRK